MSDIEREAFEAAYLELEEIAIFERDKHGDYKHEFERDAWALWQRAWQAARQAPASGEVGPIGEIDEGDEGAFVDLYPDNTFTIGQKVYTHPPAKVPEAEGFYCSAAICGGCGHVYMERPSSCDCGNDEAMDGFESAAVFIASDITTPTPATTPETEWVKLPHDVVINGGMTFKKGVKLSTFIKAAERWHREAMKQYAGISKEEIQALTHQTPTARSDGDCEIPPIYVVVTVCYQEGCSDWPAIEFPGHFSDADIEDNIYEDLCHEMHSNPGFRSYSWRRLTTPPQEQ